MVRQGAPIIRAVLVMASDELAVQSSTTKRPWLVEWIVPSFQIVAPSDFRVDDVSLT